MKKILAIVLMLALLLSLASCANNNTDAIEPTETTSSETPEASQTKEPTKEELELLDKYATAAFLLKKYNDTRIPPVYNLGDDYVYGDEALSYIYHDINAATCIEKWLGTQYTADEGVNWNREELLDRFEVLNDVLVSTHLQCYDAVGNIDTEVINTRVMYDHQGIVLKVEADPYQDPLWFNLGTWAVEDHLDGGDAHYTYDNEGKITEIKLLDGTKAKTECIITPTYNDQGLKIRDTAIDYEGNTTEFNYTYNDKKQLTSVTYTRGSTPYIYTFAYDSFGCVSKETYAELIGSNQKELLVNEYSYNDDRTECTIKHTGEYNYRDTTTVKLDTQGRILEWTEVTLDKDTRVGQKVYGTYYVFDFYEE